MQVGAAHFAQEMILFFGFDTFDSGMQAKRTCHCQHCFDQGDVVGFARKAFDKCPVDFNTLDRQAFDRPQARIPGAKIIDGKRNTNLAQFVQHADHTGFILNHAFGDLDFEIFRRQSGNSQCMLHRFGKVGHLQLADRHVDRHGDFLIKIILPAPGL